MPYFFQLLMTYERLVNHIKKKKNYMNWEFIVYSRVQVDFMFSTAIDFFFFCMDFNAMKKKYVCIFKTVTVKA